jgi:hypothetical protein
LILCEFIQGFVEREQGAAAGRSLGMQDAINNINALL